MHEARLGLSMTNFVSIFSGAGGLDIGLQRAGWDCLYATDFDKHAVATLKLNATARRFHGDGIIRQADIRDLTGGEMLSEMGKRRGDIALLAGGPPCQSWSSAGHQLGFNDPRGRLFEDYLRVAKELDVRWLLFENVRGLITARGSDGVPGSALAAIRQALFNAGWQTRVELFNAADYGVPQRRVRVVLIGFAARMCRTADFPFGLDFRRQARRSVSPDRKCGAAAAGGAYRRSFARPCEREEIRCESG